MGITEPGARWCDWHVPGALAVEKSRLEGCIAHQRSGQNQKNSWMLRLTQLDGRARKYRAADGLAFRPAAGQPRQTR